MLSVLPNVNGLVGQPQPLRKLRNISGSRRIWKENSPVPHPDTTRVVRLSIQYFGAEFVLLVGCFGVEIVLLDQCFVFEIVLLAQCVGAEAFLLVHCFVVEIDLLAQWFGAVVVLFVQCWARYYTDPNQTNQLGCVRTSPDCQTLLDCSDQIPAKQG